MSEKVLGFREKDVLSFSDYTESDGEKCYNINIGVSKLVPVVSLEWLGNIFEKFLDEISLSDEGELSKLDFATAQKTEQKIMLAAKKEAEK